MKNFWLYVILSPFIIVAIIILAGIVAILSVLGGMLFGEVVSWFWGDMILRFLEHIGITGFKLYEIGGILGFFSFFLKSSATANALMRK